MSLFQIPISAPDPIQAPTKFKIVVDAPDASFSREFTSIKALRQYQRRNPELKATDYIFHNNQWERFTIYGSQLIPKSVLQNLLNSLIEAPEASTTKT